MSELPPDGSIVAIESHQYGTYVTACPDYKTVALQPVENPNKLPKECLWTIRRNILIDYNKPLESLYFINCWNERYLAVNGLILTELCQDVLGTCFSRLVGGAWTYRHVGATRDKVAYGKLVHIRGYYLRARSYGKVDIFSSPMYSLTNTTPEVYWTIHCVGGNDTTHIAPARPRSLRSRSMEDEEHEHHHCGKSIVINNNVPNYHHSNIIESGKNVNHDGKQHIEGAIAGNTYYVNNGDGFQLKNENAPFNGTESRYHQRPVRKDDSYYRDYGRQNDQETRELPNYDAYSRMQKAFMFA